MRNVWELFKTMEPKQIEHDETTFRELKERFGSPYGFGEYFRGGMGAEASATCSSRSTSRPNAVELEEQVKTAQGPEAGARGQAPEGRQRVHPVRATSPR